jgi:hypothetical protein
VCAGSRIRLADVHGMSVVNIFYFKGTLVKELLIVEALLIAHQSCIKYRSERPFYFLRAEASYRKLNREFIVIASRQ